MATRVLLTLTVLAVLFGPKRHLFVLVVIAANIDALTTPVLNIIKQVVVPGAYAWRMGYRPRPMEAKATGLLATSFVALASIGILRSDRALAAGKFVVYLLALAILVGGMRSAFRRGRLGLADVTHGLVASVALGALAWLLGVRDAESRFTSFQTAQHYAFLLVTLVLVAGVMAKAEKAPPPYLAMAVGVTALLASGSRSGFLGLAAGVLCWLVWHVLHSDTRDSSAPLKLIVFLAATAVAVGVLSSVDTGSRTLEGLRGITGTADVGTFNFREVVNKRGWEILKAEQTPELAWGNGTSNGHFIVESSGVYRRAGYVEDPNRTVHNEYLRVTYELGVLGLLALIGTVFSVWRRSRRRRIRSLLFWVTGPSALLFLGTENTLSSGVGGSGVACALILAGALSLGDLGTEFDAPRTSASLQVEAPTNRL